MELALKPISIGRPEEQSSIITSSLKRLDYLKELQRDFDKLNNNDFLRLVAANYKFKLDEEDFKKIAEIILKSKNIKKGKIKTTITRQTKRTGIGPIWNEWYDTIEQDAVVYYKEENAPDFKHFYSKQELEELIKSGKIVFIEFVFGRRTDIDYKLPDKYNNVYQEFLPLVSISLKNLGIYEGLIIRSIKRKLQPKRLAHDICKTIDEIRVKINIQRSTLYDRIKLYERQLGECQAEYDLCLSDLDYLKEDRKEALSRLRKNN